ncbi:exosome non-catalytic core subunit rrp46 [Sorochytrium milnesiophthora]
MPRPDTRSNGQIRPMSCSQGMLSRADGSARFMFGKTAVVCGLFGPTEVRMREERLDKCTLDVICKPSIGLPSTRDKATETLIRDTLEAVVVGVLHPRSLVQLSFQTTQDDGASVAACINAAALALMDAGVPLRSLFCGVTLALGPAESSSSDNGDGDGDAVVVVLDPTLAEEQAARAVHTFVFDAALGGTYAVHSLGEFTQQEWEMCYDYAKMAAQSVLDFMRTGVQSKLTQTFLPRG